MTSRPRARGISRSVCAFALALSSLGAQAAACLYRGTDDSARVTARSGQIVTPFPDALSSADCELLRVAVGKVSVYVLGADRSAIDMRQVGVGGGALVPRPQGVEPGAAGPWDFRLLKEISLVLAGGQRSTAGSSRGGDGDDVLAALPVGKLSRPETDLVVPLGPVPDANLASFEVLVDGRSGYRQIGPARDIRLPAAVLLPGAKITWRLGYAGRQSEGRLTVVSPEQLAVLEESLTRESDAGTDPVVTLKRALDNVKPAEGFAWDARTLIRGVVSP